MKKFARQLRINSTDAESVLWYHLRNRSFLGFKFRWQMPMDKYIADFVCVEKQLVIEVDGGQHSEQVHYDEERTKMFNLMGYKVIRFWNNEVLRNLSGVLECIEENLM